MNTPLDAQLRDMTAHAEELAAEVKRLKRVIRSLHDEMASYRQGWLDERAAALRAEHLLLCERAAKCGEPLPTMPTTPTP